MDAKYHSLTANGVAWCDSRALTDPTAVKNWFSQRLICLQTNLASVAAPLAINSVTVNNDVATVTGTAPIAAQTLSFNGAPWPLVWNSVTGWTATIVLKPGTNQFSVIGLDPRGQPVAGATNFFSAVYNGLAPSAAGQVVINEIMYNPSQPDAQFVELYNNSTNLSFDLSGWDFHGLGYTFPPGSPIGPNKFLVLAANRADFAAAYGATIPVFDVYGGTLQTDGETLSLIQPGTNSASDIVISKVRYGNSPPWPTGANGTGSSFQLLDPRQDNWRVGNWSGNFPPASLSPAATNTVFTSLPAFPPL